MIKTLSKANRCLGQPKIPGDKSISHRGLILGALAEGRTRLFGLLEGEDVQSTARCLRELGVAIYKSGSCTEVEGIGAGDFPLSPQSLDCGNSGTTLRLLMGVLAGRSGKTTLMGDASLSRRPMNRVAEPLRQMGAQFVLTDQNYAPLTLNGGALNGVRYELKIASAQIKSAILLAALRARGLTTITGQVESRDHTERYLKSFGVKVVTTGTSIQMEGGQSLRACQVHIPGDPSAAAYWVGAATLVPEAHIVMDPIALNPTRIGFLRVLQRMGARIDLRTDSEIPEPVGQIRVTSAKLRGVKITRQEIPSLIDELPLLAVLASQASGVTEVEGAEELRVKESDRIEAMAQGLRAMGAIIEVRPDGFCIEGPQALVGSSVDSFQDHRVAMALSIAALVAKGQTQISNAECVGISYPEFFKTLEDLTR